MASADLDFASVYVQLRGAIYPTKLKFKGDSFIFKNPKTGLNQSIDSANISSLTWVQRSKAFSVRVQLNDGSVWFFDGFPESSFETLLSFFKSNYNIELKKKEINYGGSNWGTFRFQGESLDFEVDDKSAFEIPIRLVSQATYTKNELVLEFHQNEDVEVNVSEVRFYIPQVEGNEGDSSLAETAYNKIMKRADIVQVTGTAIVSFKDLSCLQPRSRFELKIYPTLFYMHGLSFNYTIPYSSLLRMFLLEHPQQNSFFLVLILDPPLKHGMTRYQSIIFSFETETNVDATLNISPEDLINKYNGKLTENMSGPQYEIVTQIIRVISGKKIYGEGSFESKANVGKHVIQCQFGTTPGLLYPLERSFLFLPRPGLNLRHDEIRCAIFNRGASISKTFDLELQCNNGPSYNFRSIVKCEYKGIFQFLTKHGIKIKTEDDDDVFQTTKVGSDLDDEADDAEVDPYKERMIKEGRMRQSMMAAQQKNRVQNQDDDSDDADEDADFDPDAMEEKSDVDEEYDSNASYNSSSDDNSSDNDTSKKEKSHKDKKRSLGENSSDSKPSKKRKLEKNDDSPKKKISKPGGSQALKSEEFVESDGSSD